MSTQTVVGSPVRSEIGEASVAIQQDPPCLPQHSPVSARKSYAGFWRRVAAFLIDLVILYAIELVLVLVLVLYVVNLTGVTDDAIDVIVHLFIQLFQLIGVWLYFSLFESSQKQATPGKLALHIKVVGPDGSRISFGRATGRHFAKILSGLTLGVGYIMAGFTAKRQTLHDIVADCFAVKRGNPAREQTGPAAACGEEAVRQWILRSDQHAKWGVLAFLLAVLVGIILVRLSAEGVL